jgi:hypothetical protein
LYNITVDWSIFNQSMRDSAVPGTSATSDEEQLEAIEPLDANRAPESVLIHARQHTMLWNEAHMLKNYRSRRYTLESGDG